MMISHAEDWAAALASAGDGVHAAVLMGAADSAILQTGNSPSLGQHNEIAAPINQARAAVSPDEWDTAYFRGYMMPLREALEQVAAETSDTVAARVGDVPGHHT